MLIKLSKNTFVDFVIYFLNGYQQWSTGLGRGSSWMKSGMGVWLSLGLRGRNGLDAGVGGCTRQSRPAFGVCHTI